MCAEGNCNRMIVEHGKSPEPCKIKLIKQAKAWAWEISYSGSDFLSIKAEIDKANDELMKTYGGFKE